MRALFAFLGGVHFALTLIFFTLLIVIAGTFLESWTASHLFAAGWTYHSPFFSLLLWLYFLNILFAALRRWPFHRHHIPFLLTHLGLLMLLGGALVKQMWGTQGEVAIAEGVESDTLFLPHTYALTIEDREKSAQIALLPKRKGALPSPFPSLSIQLTNWHPHGAEELDGWIDEEAVHLIGLPPFPLFPLQKPLRPSLKTEGYTLWGVEGADPKDVTFEGTGIAFIRTAQQKKYLVAQNAEGERTTTPLDTETLMIFDKGFRGYAAFCALPPSFPSLELLSPLMRTLTPKKAHHKREELTPLITLSLSENGKTEQIQLLYDPHCTKLKWPILNGRYLVRFHAQQERIPHTVQLHQARQINYPGSAQPLSFESDLLIDKEAVVIAMNRVHETQKGYRFYLANLHTPHQTAATRAQIVVNRDPGKRLLTYPGAFILAIGILALYFQKRYV